MISYHTPHARSKKFGRSLFDRSRKSECFFFSRLTQAGSCAISLFSLAFDDICDLLLKIKDVERNGVFVGSTMVLWSISQLLTRSL